MEYKDVAIRKQQDRMIYGPAGTPLGRWPVSFNYDDPTDNRVFVYVKGIEVPTMPCGPGCCKLIRDADVHKLKN